VNNLRAALIVIVSLVFCACGTGPGSSGTAAHATPAREASTAEAAGVVDAQTESDALEPDPSAYPVFAAMSEPGPQIPGIFRGLVPQGMAYYGTADLMLISSYADDRRASRVFAVRMTDGSVQKELNIEEPDGSVHTGHVGGLAMSAAHLWIASGPGVFRAGLDVLQGAGALRTDAFIRTAAKGSFATFDDQTLWVGEFTNLSGNYPTDPSHRFRTSSGVQNHGWLAGFRVDGGSDTIVNSPSADGIVYPDRIISIPHQVQGAAFLDDRIILSESYGRTNNSRIDIYANPLKGPASGYYDAPGGAEIPVWVLDRSNHVETILAPPMTEALARYQEKIAVLFESASDKYRETAFDPVGTIQLLDIERD